MTVANPIHTNQSIFVPINTGSPRDGLMAHISSLGQIARLDFERHAIAGEIILAIEGDATPTTQLEEEARIGSLAYALRKLDNPADAAEFTRCLNAICDEADARYRQMAASHYYGEIARRGAAEVLKEMALLAMQMESLQSIPEEIETEEVIASLLCEEAEAKSLFDQELAAIRHRIRGHRRAARLPHDDAGWIDDLEANGASCEELDAAFEHLEAMQLYDEGGAILLMSSHERTVACGRIDPEYTAEDLPERAQHLARELRCGYASGTPLDAIWEDLNAQIEVLFPIRMRTEGGGRFYSHANREWQQFTRTVLEAILIECEQDFHLTALRHCRAYREFHSAIRRAGDTKSIGDLMKRAYEARLSGRLSIKHFTALKTAAILQRERLESARLSTAAVQLLNEVQDASPSKLRFLLWACYGNNQPAHPIHRIAQQDRKRIWQAIKERQQTHLQCKAA